jgi:hypothetical protein
VTLEELIALPVTDREVALFQRDDDGVFCDAEGQWWLTGWLDGVRVRRVFR